MRNKFIKLITADNRFAIPFMCVAMFVTVKAANNPHSLWVQIGWAMLITLGIIVTITAYVTTADATQSKKWPRIKATLLEANVQSSWSNSQNSNNTRVYYPNITYEFVSNNKTYQGNNYDFSSTSASQSWAQGIVDEVLNNKESLMVYVNPEDPTISVIKPGIKVVHLLRFIVGPAMIILGISFWLGIIHLPLKH